MSAHDPATGCALLVIAGLIALVAFYAALVLYGPLTAILLIVAFGLIAYLVLSQPVDEDW